MKDEIISNIDNPRQLEKLYRDHKAAFKKSFNLAYPDIHEKTAARVWNERLNFEGEDISWGSSKEFAVIILLSMAAAIIAKIPWLTGIKDDFFYPRNLGFVFLPALTVFFAWRQRLSAKHQAIIASAILLSVLYINFLPDSSNSDTLTLACIHLPLFVWTLLGFSFTGGNLADHEKRLDFLRYNGDLVVMSVLIMISGGILTGITIGLFSLIGIDIKDFYFDFIVACGAASLPVVSTWLVLNNPQLVNKVSPVIARIFTPLVLVTLVIYLGAVISTGKNPYNDREFLLIFNALLIGVMAIIFFSAAETSKKKSGKTEIILLAALSVLTIIVNSIALSAIIFRIAEGGITPNRVAVLGGNTLMLANLVLVAAKLFGSLRRPESIDGVGRSLVSFLPLYSAWTAIVVFLFPLLLDTVNFHR
jgi:hypothetical protein